MIVAQMVRLLDSDLRRAIKNAQAELKGGKRWPEMEKYLKYKKSRLDEPWKAKGIDEGGSTGTWESNAKSTALKKFGKQLPQMFRSDRTGRAVEVRPENKEHMKGGGVMVKKQVTMAMRRAKILESTGALRRGVKVRKSKVSAGLRLVIAVSGSAAKYAYFHLHGGSAKWRTFRRRWEGSKGQKQLVIREKSGTTSYPARPWGVWTNRDLNELARAMERWGARAL